MRVAAPVNVTMRPDEVADTLGVPVEALLSYKNGVAVIAKGVKPEPNSDSDEDEALEEE